MKPPAGCREAVDKQTGIIIARLHFRADPAKDEAWAAEQRRTSISEAAYQQELEINFSAYAGQLLFPELQQDVTVIEPFSVPHDWTRFMGLDTHPRVAHYFGWLAVDPYGELYYYREYWPSKIYGQPGPIPEDDAIYMVDDYLKTMHWQESAAVDMFAPNGFADNGGRDEKVNLRVCDPSAKAWASERTHGKEGAETFWDRYTSCRDENGKFIGINLVGAKKDFEASRDIVGRWLRPRRYIDGQGERQKPQLQIFSTCKELIYELKTNRYPRLTPTQAATKDPSDKPIAIRRHATDVLRYLAMLEPRYVEHLQPNEPQRIYPEINW